MITAPERSDARDAAIDALLPLVPDHGWTIAALRQAAGENADLLFPGGPAEMVETYIDLADRRMAVAAATQMTGQRLHQKVRTLIATRFAQASHHKAAVRRAFGVLSQPETSPPPPAAPPALSTRSGTPQATNPPTSAGTPSAPSSPRSIPPPCCSGWATIPTARQPSPSSTGAWPASPG